MIKQFVILLMEEIQLTTWDVLNLVKNGHKFNKLPANWSKFLQSTVVGVDSPSLA